MKFGQDKCAYIKIEKGKSTATLAIEINGLKIKPILEGESYGYLGQDENVAYDGTINKERVTKEYLLHVKKIWSSELSAYNKTIAHKVIWNAKEKTCDIIEVSCPAGINITKKEEEKLSTYIPLIRSLQIMHPNYHYRIIPIIVGALWSIPKSLHGYVCRLGFNNFE